MADLEKKKPGLAALVIGMGKPKVGDGDDTTEDGSEASDEDYSEACSEVFDCLKNEDREGFAQALKAAIASAK